MTPNHPSARWLARLERDGGPIYLGLVRALDAAIRAGELQPGDQLPPQRTVADLLGIDFTTVSRAYGAARARGLLEGAVGRGTFVRSGAAEDEAGLVDLSMNLAPPPDGLSLGALIQQTSADVLASSDAATLMAYHPGAGTLGQKAAGAAWLAPVLGPVAAERVLVCAGAQTALAAALTSLLRPGDALVTEPLTYPGIKALAAQLGLRLIACEADADGVIPEALERLCRKEQPRALYVVPTMQNPTASTMGEARRGAVAQVVQAQGLWIIEDDPYSRLMDAPPPALRTFAPDRTVHIATLSKCFSPGLRIAFLVCPENGGGGEALAAGLRSLSLMPAPLMAAVVGRWMREGTADALLAAVRKEARARRAIAAKALPAAEGPADSIHVWLPLPNSWSPEALRAAGQARGLSLVAADAFAVGPAQPNGVRISLGGPAKRGVLEQALSSIAGLANGAPGDRLVV